ADATAPQAARETATTCGSPPAVADPPDRRPAIAVEIMPGSTSATRMLSGFTSCASPSDSASSAHLLAVYGVAGELEKRPATELTLMMHPLRRCFMSGKHALMQRKLPK